MLPTILVYALAWAMGFSLASSSPPPMDASRGVRNAPSALSLDTLGAFRRAMANLHSQDPDTVFRNSTSFQKSFDGAVLFEEQVYASLSRSAEQSAKNGSVSAHAGVKIVCRTCYVKATATAELTMDGNFNVSQAVSNLTEQVGTQVENVTDTVKDLAGQYFTNVTDKFSDGIDLEDFDIPPIDVNLDIQVPDVPECRLRFQFDGLEIYSAIDTKLSGGVTYSLNLFSSQTALGISLNDEFSLGVVLKLDLILSADAEIDVSSGFHIQLDDGTSLSMTLFGENFTDTQFNGGQFEFLPVQIQSSGAVLKAVLRLGVFTGIELSTPELMGFSTSAGIAAVAFSHLAEFTSNITAAPLDDDDDDEGDCKLKVENSYQLAVGAKAGATVALGDHTWGPAPSTSIPIYFTALNACAVRGSATPAVTAPAIADRAAQADTEDLETTTISTEVTYTGIGCISTQLVDCPASLQTVKKVTSDITLVTAVPSGVEPTFPATTQTSVLRPVEFGKDVHKLLETSGSPTSFVPEPTSVRDAIDRAGAVDKRIVIGACVGGGALLLLSILAGVWCCRRRRRAEFTAATHFTQAQVTEPYDPKKTHNTVSTW